MFCKNCGEKLDEGTRFCTKCGTAVDQAAAPMQYQQPVAPEQQGAYQQPVAAVKKNGWQYFIGVFKKYAVFSGRARRAEFWWFILFYVIASVIVNLLDWYIFLAGRGILNLLWSLAAFLPSLGLWVRRMHDCDKAGPFFFIPIYGWIVLPLTEGTRGPNRFGADPKLES